MEPTGTTAEHTETGPGPTFKNQVNLDLETGGPTPPQQEVEQPAVLARAYPVQDATVEKAGGWFRPRRIPSKVALGLVIVVLIGTILAISIGVACSNGSCSGAAEPAPANPKELLNYCGVRFSDALDCHQACPGGQDQECPTGETCISDITTCSGEDTSQNSTSQNSNYCGISYEEANCSTQPCPFGLNGECPPGQQCFNIGVTCG